MSDVYRIKYIDSNGAVQYVKQVHSADRIESGPIGSIWTNKASAESALDKFNRITGGKIEFIFVECDIVDRADPFAGKNYPKDENGVAYGCYCDCEIDGDRLIPLDDCVLDVNKPQDCVYASEGGNKWKCSEWRKVEM